MDNVASMIQSDQRTDEFQFFPTLANTDELMSIPTEDTNVVSRGSDYRQRRRKAAEAFGFNDVDIGKINNSNKKKKIKRRDIERQRRQEMANLYATLRSLLPFEYLKGKRSISDQMNEAVNYINHLQKRILELSDKRDELRKSPNSYASSFVPESSQDSSEDSVMVRPCLAGVEVVISTHLRKGLRFSSVLEVMAAEGLSVVSCISTKVHKRLMMHTIVSEVNEGRSIEPSELQHKLTILLKEFIDLSYSKVGSQNG